jgi:sterol 3beta-glucosyltransferase
MRICILTVGTRGDVQPYVALGTALRAAGHEVKVATLGGYEALVRAYGLEFALFEESPLSFLERVIASGGSFLRRAYETKGILNSMMERLLADALRVAHEADLIITSNLLIYPGYQLSNLLSVPSIGTFLVPYLRTRLFPNPAFLSGRHSLTGPGNLLTYDIFNEAMWQLYRGSMNRHQRRFGLRPLPRWGMARQMRRDHYPFLCAYSPSIVPTPTDWSGDIHVTGYWFLDAPTHWEPPRGAPGFSGCRTTSGVYRLRQHEVCRSCWSGQADR